LDSGAGAAFEGGASSVRITATFVGLGRLIAACAASSIAAPDFNATSVQIASGLNRRNGAGRRASRDQPPEADESGGDPDRGRAALEGGTRPAVQIG